MKFVAQNIQKYDVFKSVVFSNILLESADFTKDDSFVSNFTIGIIIRNLILTDRYIFKLLNYIENEEIVKSSDDEYKAWKSLDFILESASKILSTNIHIRQMFKKNKNYYSLITRLRPFSGNIEQIYKIYRLTDDTDFFVIHPEKLVGFKVVANGIQNNFHFFTLLQHELCNKAGNILGISIPKDPDQVLIAKGLKKFDIDRKIADSSVLNFYSWKSFYESKKKKKPLDARYLLKGKQMPIYIPTIDGIKILIIGEDTSHHLKWDTSEFRPINQHLTSSVEISDILKKEQVLEILKKILQYRH
jgi:hypothetical protein